MKRKLFLIPALMLAGLLVLTGCPPVGEDEKPPVVNTANLQVAISDAEGLISNTAVSTDGKDVMPRDKWVTQAAVNELNGAISIAKAALSGTQDAVDAMTITLKTAIDVFKDAQKDGLKDFGFDLTDLEDLIDSAKSELAAAEVKDNGDEVNPASFWITPADKAILEGRISTAEAITASNTQEQIDAAYNGIITALTAIRPGSSTAESKSNLLAAIGDAGSVKTGVAIDTAKENVSKGALWVTQAQMDALNAAIPPAQAVYDNPNVTKKTVDDAITALNNAINTFETALTANGPGTKETPASDQITLGINALKNNNYDLAITHFNNAYNVDNASQEAILYSSLAMLASIPVNSNVRSFMSDRLGIKNYPTTLNDLFDIESWMDEYEDEYLVYWYSEGNRHFNWFNSDDDWLFNNYPHLERKSGYYSWGPRYTSNGITTKRTAEISQWINEGGNGYNWLTTHPNTGDAIPPGYYNWGYDEDNDIWGYLLFSDEPRYQILNQYFAFDINSSVSWYTTHPYTGATIPPGYYYWYWNNHTNTSEIIFYSSEPKYSGADGYYDSSVGNMVYWIDGFPGANLFGFTVPGYYRVDWGQTLMSETPRYEIRGNIPFPNFDVPSWFSETNAYSGSYTTSGLKSVNTMAMVMFANLLDKNTNGLNALLDGLLNAVLGSNFEAAYTRAQNLTGRVLVSHDLLEAFGLDFIFEGADFEIGKAELNMLFATMRVFKASLEWVAAYDWNTDLNFVKHGPLLDNGILPTTKPANLPFRNNFLKDRGNGMMQKSKDNFVLAINDIIASYDFFIGSSSYLPDAYKDVLNEFLWLKDGSIKLRNAISTGGSFWLNDSSMSGNTYNNIEAGALFGIDFGKFFTPGYLAINRLIEPAAADNTRPEFYGYNELLDDYVKVTSRDQINSYSLLGFKFIFEPFTDIFILKSVELPEDEMVLGFIPPDVALTIWDWYH